MKTLESELVEFINANREEIFRQADAESNLELEVPIVPIIDTYIDSLNQPKDVRGHLKAQFYYQMLPNLEYARAMLQLFGGPKND